MSPILNRLQIVVAISASSLAFVVPIQAETWTDATGKFKIEAEFQGVVGSSIALRKPDGSTVNVPIAKLSPTSRERAKDLYEQQKSTFTTESTASAPAMSADTTSSSKGSKLTVTPPEPSAVEPMPPFPENASLQQTIDFAADQLIAGHPEVFWYMLPSDIREAMDREDLRAKAGSYIQQQVSASQQTDEVMMKALDLLISKKAFVLNSPLMSQVPPQFAPIVTQAYDPAIGLIYELSQISRGLEDIQNRTISQILDDHGPRVGGHLKSLIALAPPELVRTIRGSMVAAETDASSGNVKSIGPDGQESTVEFVRHNDRWIPKTLADAWNESKDDLDSKLEEGIELANEQSAQSMMVAALFVGMANSLIEPLAAATTQDEFDAAIGQAMQMAGKMGPGGAAGGF